MLLNLPEVTPAAGKAATLEAFLSLRKALSVCDEDLSRPDSSAAGSAWGWGRRSSSWGRRKRADGPFDPDAAALVRLFIVEKKSKTCGKGRKSGKTLDFVFCNAHFFESARLTTAKQYQQGLPFVVLLILSYVHALELLARGVRVYRFLFFVC